jgi:3-deoxy-D-manno-octulosonic-acid transferase
MIRLIYNLLWPIGLLFFLPRYLIKMFRRGGYRTKFGQRFGTYHVDLRDRFAKQKPIWLHAVSVGEVAIALKLAARLRLLRPEQTLALTTTTTTGFAFANANAPPWVEVMYSPLDFWPIMRHAFAVIQPERIALVEAEVWPNLVAEATKRKIPLALVNARLSPRSERRFRKFRLFVSPMFRSLDLVCVQYPEDVARWTTLGVSGDRIRHTGSIKYDPEDSEVDASPARSILLAHKVDLQCPVLFGGSTHHGEEEALAKIFREARAKFPNLFLILAPRHVERSAAIRKQLEQVGLKVALRSETSVGGEPIDCLLIDSTGELKNWYPVASVIFVGKSLTARGGQNPAEAIVAGKPVVFGPHMENFAAFADALVERRGAIQVQSAPQLQNAIVDLLDDPELSATLVRNGRGVLAEHRGAAARTAQLLVDL